jgi:hypothetical protein
MRRTFTITVYNDAGHAWGKVKRQVLQELNLLPKVSSYSYQYKDNVYLEEDCDLNMLCQLLNEQDVRVKFVEKFTTGNSRIRSYERFQA